MHAEKAKALTLLALLVLQIPLTVAAYGQKGLASNDKLLVHALAAQIILRKLVEVTSSVAPKELIDRARKLLSTNVADLSEAELKSYIEAVREVVRELAKYVNPSPQASERAVKALREAIEYRLRILERTGFIPSSLIDPVKRKLENARKIRELVRTLKLIRPYLVAAASKQVLNVSLMSLRVYVYSWNDLNKVSSMIVKAYYIIASLAKRLEEANKTNVAGLLKAAAANLNKTLELIEHVKAVSVNETLIPLKDRLKEAIRIEIERLENITASTKVPKGIMRFLEEAISRAEEVIKSQNASLGQLIATLVKLKNLEYMVAVKLEKKGQQYTSIPPGILLELAGAKALARYAKALSKQLNDTKLAALADSLAKICGEAEEAVFRGDMATVTQKLKAVRLLKAQVMSEIAKLHRNLAAELWIKATVKQVQTLAKRLLNETERARINETVRAKVEQLAREALERLDQALSALEKGNTGEAMKALNEAIELVAKAWRLLGKRVVLPLIVNLDEWLRIRFKFLNVTDISKKVGIQPAKHACDPKLLSKVKLILKKMFAGNLSPRDATLELRAIAANASEYRSSLGSFIEHVASIVEKYADVLAATGPEEHRLTTKARTLLLKAIDVACVSPNLGIWLLKEVEKLLSRASGT